MRNLPFLCDKPRECLRNAKEKEAQLMILALIASIMEMFYILLKQSYKIFWVPHPSIHSDSGFRPKVNCFSAILYQKIKS